MLNRQHDLTPSADTIFELEFKLLHGAPLYKDDSSSNYYGDIIIEVHGATLDDYTTLDSLSIVCGADSNCESKEAGSEDFV